ncbi:MAG: aminoglycoside phosphotransferase family protein [Eubacteriales bacterium]
MTTLVKMDTDKIISHFGKSFFNTLLEKLDIYAAKWHLSNLEQIDYYSVNSIFKCLSQTHGRCILKIGKPCRQTQTEYNALNEYAGYPFCRIYEADIQNGVMLIEEITPGRRLRDIPGLDIRLEIFCYLFNTLHKTAADKFLYPTYQDWVTRIAAYMRQRDDYKTLSSYMDKAEQICKELWEKYPGNFLLHGDLHHDNILLGADGRYYIIDPKGVVGGRVFDIPRFILNEFGDEITEDFKGKYLYIIKTLSNKLSVPEIDIKKLVFVEMSMAHCWNVEDGLLPDIREVEFTKTIMEDEYYVN